MKHYWDFIVRSYELDMNKHVNNAIYLNYFEAARMAYLNDIGFDFQLFNDKGFSLIVTKIEVVYKSPAFLNDKLTVITQPLILKKASGLFDQSICRNKKQFICSAKITWACINSQHRPTPLPKEFTLPGLIPSAEEIK